MVRSQVTTKKHFHIFRKSCEKWMDKFGLIGWKRAFFHEKDKDLPHSRATVHTDIQNSLATFRLIPRWKIDESGEGFYQVTEESMNRAALHEVIHVILAKLKWMVSARWALDPSDVDEENERLVQIIERVIWDYEQKLKDSLKSDK